VRTICSACGTAVPTPARFCTACGARLGSGAVELPEQEPPAAVTAGPPVGDDTVPPAESVDGPTPREDEVPTPREDDEPARVADAPESPAEAPPAVLGGRDPEPSLPAFHLVSTADELPLPALHGPALSPAPQRPAPMAQAPPLPPPADAPPPVLRVAEAPRERAVPEPRPAARAQAEAPTGKARVVTAGALPRLGAFLVDFVIVSLGQSLLALPALAYWTKGDPAAADAPSFLPIFLSVTLAALAVILAAVYHVYFWGVKAATPGKRLFGLVVQGQDGRLPIGPGRAALRLVGYVVSGLVFGIGFLMIAFGGGGLHDQIAGTRVVRRKGD
jgi:uncharacterized RDD family membrane protein YckC